MSAKIHEDTDWESQESQGQTFTQESQGQILFTKWHTDASDPVAGSYETGVDSHGASLGHSIV